MMEMLDVAMAGPGVVRRLRSCREGQRPEGGGGTESLLPGALFHTREKDTQEKSWARGAQDQPVTQHAPSRRSTIWHYQTVNVSCAEVGCPCETLGKLAGTGCYNGMPPGS